ncbi:hypothetical protein [Hyphomicrobium sp. CS1GBMeth3]|uniref:hypothetical protein n=1 Tax=Hyphomicrobium sp. CS1GBMeth3 TaxID=1892845 RepID=UPI000931B199|nr:hypothetical protein [Hyphomicrobium sp. CS1GBMeth3]
MPTRGWLIVHAALLSASLVSPAAAQSTPKPLPPAPPEVMEPPNENPVPPADPGTNAGRAEKPPLTKELKENEGVLEPPRGVDPGIEKAPPEDFKGKTPVIPPPGEPGGNQDRQPQ